MIVTVAVEVAAPRELVFDLMADARNEAAWNSQVSTSELTSDEPIGEGTTFLTVNRGRPYDATIRSYDRPDALLFDVVGTAMVIQGAFDFEDSGTGTTVTGTFDMEPKGFMKVLMPMMAGAVRKSFPKELDSFRAFCEARAGAENA